MEEKRNDAAHHARGCQSEPITATQDINDFEDLPPGLVRVDDPRFNDAQRATLRALLLADWRTLNEVYPPSGKSLQSAGVTPAALGALMNTNDWRKSGDPARRPPEVMNQIWQESDTEARFTLAAHLVGISLLDPAAVVRRNEIIPSDCRIPAETAAELKTFYPELEQWSTKQVQEAWENYSLEVRGHGVVITARDEVFLVYLHIVQTDPTYRFEGKRATPGVWEAYARTKPWLTGEPPFVLNADAQ